MKLAFVIPWYGERIPGGAEYATRRLAETLAARGRAVEVLTTCIRDFHSDWSKNHHRAGTTVENGVTVRRFKVVRRNTHLFDDLNGRLLRGLMLTIEEETRFMQEMVISPDLLSFIQAHCSDYQFFFTPYLFSTSYYGMQLCPAQSWLIPCLHDECYASLRLVKEMFEAARGVVFLSYPERDLAQHLYRLERARTGLIGVGIDAGQIGDADRFRRQYDIICPFVLYVGRRDAGKNVPQLIDYFCRYRETHVRALKLVLMGSGEIAVPSNHSGDIIDLGFVTPSTKADALAAAALLCQPSKNESFSLVIMEAWLAGTPSLVHADCLVTADHCRRSNGGLYFGDYFEFAGCLDFLLDHPEMARRIGQLGGQYVRTNFNWDTVINRFDYVIQS
jgi:glycosyltransferase involved in cell wall biosynthesis